MGNITLRPAAKHDIDFLWEMLYEAIYVRKGDKKPPKHILQHPTIARYLTNWGRNGDSGFIAEDADKRPVGAIWIRLFDGSNKTYGFVDEQIPVLSMALVDGYRGKGMGTQLMDALIKAAKQAGYPALSLSVDPENPARRLYEKFGFTRVNLDGTSWDMVLPVNNQIPAKKEH